MGWGPTQRHTQRPLGCARCGRSGSERLVAGLPGGAFKGELSLDRYQLATTLARVLADSPLPVRESEVRFKDVKPNHWALPGIRRMVGEGLVQGFPDQTYRGASVLTRYQLSLVLDKLAQSLGIAAPARALRPDDLSAGHWAEGAVMRMIGLDVLPLGADGLFRGNQPVNRYQMARAPWRIGQLGLSIQGSTAQGDVASARPKNTPQSPISSALPANQTRVDSKSPNDPADAVGSGGGFNGFDTKGDTAVPP